MENKLFAGAGRGRPAVKPKAGPVGAGRGWSGLETYRIPNRLDSVINSGVMFHGKSVMIWRISA